MASLAAPTPRKRRSYARLQRVIDVPNLIDIQVASFERFMQDGLRETIDDISPIEDYTGSLAVEFGDYEFEPPKLDIKECREKDQTYQAALHMTVRFVNKTTGEIREQRVFMGDFPRMTDWGTFIINGTERVVVTQLVRSPGAYLLAPKDPTKQVFTANLMPSRGSWLELEIDKKGQVTVRIDRKRKLPITTLLRALPQDDPTTGFVLDTTTDEAIVDLFRDPETGEPNPFIALTLDKDLTKREDEALIEVFKKQRPGEPPTLENARALLRSLFFDAKRYDLTKVGRYKLNVRLHGYDDVDGAEPVVPMDVRTLTTQDILALVRKLVSLPVRLGVPADSTNFAEEAFSLPYQPIARELDEYEHFGNRRLRDVGELIQEAFRDRSLPHGARRARADDDRGRRHDHAAVDHQHPAGRGGAQGVLRLLAALAVHGPDELARGAHPSPAALRPRRRRPDARARTDRGARRPPDALRPHVPDRDARGSEHRPHRLALELRDRVRVRLHPGALPARDQRLPDRRDRLPGRLEGGEARHRAGQRRGRQEGQARRARHRTSRRRRAGPGRPVRGRLHGRRARADRLGRHGADPVPRAQRREPRADGLEHAAPGSAADDHPGALRGHRARAPRRHGHRRCRDRPRAGHDHARRRRSHRDRVERRRCPGVPAHQVHAARTRAR